MPRERSMTSRERGVRASVVMGRGLKYLGCLPPAQGRWGAPDHELLTAHPPPQPSSRNKNASTPTSSPPQWEGRRP